MKNLLKYLILIILPAALFNIAGSSDSSSPNDTSSAFCIDATSLSESFSAADSGISAPRTTSFSYPTRVQTNARRTANANNRTPVEFVKSGKAFNTSVIYSVHHNNITTSISETGHAHKLVYLGKLLI